MAKIECVKKNKLGECIEWKEVGGELVAEFKEADKNCNPKLFKDWENHFKDRKIRVRLVD